MAFAGLIQAGLYGIENKLELEDPLMGNIYQNKKAKSVPGTLREAIDLAKKSKLLPKIFQPDVLEHYIHEYSAPKHQVGKSWGVT